jgi:serine/threonine-protein kinase
VTGARDAAGKGWITFVLPTAQDLSGRDIGGYRLVRPLGSGASGMVFLGERDGGEHTQAAVKLLILPPQLTDQQQAEFQTRFRREVLTLLELNHPHILSVLGFGQDSATGHSYLILPYVESTLARRLSSARAPMPFDEVARYATQLAEALDYAHQHGVIHRDIKPSNVLLDREGQVYLTDFSIAHLFGLTRTNITATGQVLGTPNYMAPEQFRGDRVAPATDIYSLGALLYQLIAGRMPFEGGSVYELVQRVTTQQPPSAREFRPELPEAANAALIRALVKRPEQRFATASDLAQAVTKGLQGEWVENLRSHAAFGAGDRTEPNSSVVVPSSWPIPEKSQRRTRILPKDGTNRSLILTASILGAIVIVGFIGGYVLLPALWASDRWTQLTSQGSLFPVATVTPSPTPTQQPTPTAVPTPTPVFSYSAAIPGPGCGSSGWVEADHPSGTVQCASAGLLMASPAGATANTDVFWNGAGSNPTSYSVRVSVSKLTSACGGIGFQNGYRAYIGYICANGAWAVIRYDSTGSPTQLDKGFVAQQSPQLLEVIVTSGSTFQFHIGSSMVFTDSIASGYDTQSVTLALYAYNGQSGQGYFSDFVYGQD